MDQEIEALLEQKLAEARKNTEKALAYMARFGIRPEGEVRLFYPPESRRTNIDRIPYSRNVREVVVYQTEPGEFSAVCPYSGLPDYGVLRVEYVPGSWLLELKSLKYYLISFREIGITQEEVTAIIFEDLMKHLEDPEYLVVETVYNVRGGIRTTVVVDSREQRKRSKST